MQLITDIGQLYSLVFRRQMQVSASSMQQLVVQSEITYSIHVTKTRIQTNSNGTRFQTFFYRLLLIHYNPFHKGYLEILILNFFYFQFIFSVVFFHF